MTRIIVGFDPSRGQAAIAELRNGLGRGVEWRVLNLQQNPNGVQPMRPTANEEQPDESPNLIQKLAGLFDKDDKEETGPRVDSPVPPSSNSPLDLSEEELEYLRRAPARAATVIVVTAPDGEDTAVRTWSMRHGGFSLAPAQAPDTETEIKES